MYIVRFLYFVIFTVILSGCIANTPLDTSPSLEYSAGDGELRSGEMYLKALDGRNDILSLNLEHKIGTSDHLLYLFWSGNRGWKHNFNKETNKIDILLDNGVIFSLVSYDGPRISEYDVNNSGIKEYVGFNISNTQLMLMNQSGRIEIVIHGRVSTLRTKFNLISKKKLARYCGET